MSYTRRRRGKDLMPREACRCCGAGTVHTQDYGKPTPDCIEFLRGTIRLMEKQIDALEEAPDTARINWLEENHKFRGGGSGGTFTFDTPADTECFRDAIDAAMVNATAREG